MLIHIYRWWHGNLDNPPAAGQSFALPANGKVDVMIASNKANTPLGRGFVDANPRVAPVPWLNENGWGSKLSVKALIISSISSLTRGFS